MNKMKALNKFFNDFMTAYPSTAVPTDAVFPYMTYEAITDDFDHPVSITAQMYFKTHSEAEPNRYAEEFAEYIGRGGTLMPYDTGAFWVTKGSPFCQSLAEVDNSYKRRVINLNIEFID